MKGAAVPVGHPSPPGPLRYTVDAPGGRLLVDVATDGTMTLTGPAHLTARGTVRLHTAWPPPARNGERGLQQPHGVPTPALLARAERGLEHLAHLHTTRADQ
ncbi:hypothetical protein ACH4TC_38490 [Streptomyces spororaveus]|uniref:hypothetical protein n=1 Tax=Streptomyces spororaveus TaxID=284039 RepID=UPI00379BC4D2